jgi:hypothetical protein
MISPTPRLEPATEEDILRWYGPIEFHAQWLGQVLKKGSLVVGFGGMIEIEPGVWLAFLECPEKYRKPTFLRHILRMMDDARALGATEIRAARNPDIPRPDALLQHLGFVETEEKYNDQAVWVWRQ